jgi:F-type H+-transporting ATPase subunit delta
MASAVANRYARALVDVIARPGSPVNAEQALAELGAFAAAFSSSLELRNVLLSPAVPPVKKRIVITQVGDKLDLSKTSRNFLCVVADHRRLALLDEMVAAVQGLLDERLGIVRAAVTSAQPVTPGQQEAVAAQLSALTGRQVRAQFSVDPALLGGIVARIGSTIYDGSLRSQLHALERDLASE